MRWPVTCGPPSTSDGMRTSMRLAAGRAPLPEPFAHRHHRVAVVVALEVEEHEVDERVLGQRFGAGLGVDRRAAVGPARRGVLVGHEHAEGGLARGPEIQHRRPAPGHDPPRAAPAPGASRHERHRCLPLTVIPSPAGRRRFYAGPCPASRRRHASIRSSVRRSVAFLLAALTCGALAGHRSGARPRRSPAPGLAGPTRAPGHHHQQRRLPVARRGRGGARPTRP